MDRISLPNAYRDRLRDQLVRAPSPYEGLDDFLVELHAAFANLPRQVLKAIFNFRNDPTCYGALLFENFPVDPILPPTPLDARRAMQKSTFVSEACVLGIARLLGEPIGYRDEKEGEIVHNLCPVELDASATSSDNSQIALGFHTDFNFDKDHPEQPYNVINSDYVLLVCLRSDRYQQARTRYADARDICSMLSQSEIAALRANSFEFAASYSFTGASGSKRLWSVPCSVIKGPVELPEISIDLMCGIRSLNSVAASALARVKEICERPGVATEVCLKPGDILLMDNRKGAHSRTIFFAAFDGLDRWLQRIYVRRSLWELRRGGMQTPRVY
jgi:L-asparagine oxygenase